MNRRPLRRHKSRYILITSHPGTGVVRSGKSTNSPLADARATHRSRSRCRPDNNQLPPREAQGWEAR